MIDIKASLAAYTRQNAQGCVKTWEDLERYSTVIKKVQPDLIIETGTFSGKSALWFARTAGCRVVTIETTPYIDPEIEEAWREHDITLINESSVEPHTIDTVRDHAAGAERVLLSLDSYHSEQHVLTEMEAYGPLVTPGSYMVVEDGILRYMEPEDRHTYIGDPLDAIERYLKAHKEWEIDLEIEEIHPVSQFPSGWLLRR